MKLDIQNLDFFYGKTRALKAVSMPVARNAVTAGLVGAAGALTASSIWGAEHGAVERAVLHHSNPSIFVVDTAFIAFVVGTDLARRSHWSHWWWRSGAALLLSGLAVGTLTPFAVVIVLFGGSERDLGTTSCAGRR